MPQTGTILEYQQQKIDASAGRFNGNLNSMAENGWTVVSIDRVDNHFLVTYSRPKRMRQPLTDPRTRTREVEMEVEVEVRTQYKTTQSLNYEEFREEVHKNLQANWVIQHLVTSTVPMTPFIAYYTCIWERTSEKVIE